MISILNLIRTPKINVKPDSAAIISNDTEITYSELESLIKKTSYGLTEVGVKENDLVTLLFENNTDCIVVVPALWQIGAVPVPLNIKLLEKDLNEQIDFLQPGLTLRSKKFKDVNLRGKVSTFPKLTFPDNNEEIIIKNFSKDTTALILFTSGSSGKPKAVMLTFDNLIQSALIGNKVLNHTSEDKWLASLPFYHIGGFSIIFRALMFGSSVIVPESLSNDDLLESIKTHKPTLASVVSSQLKYFLDKDFIPPEELRTVLLGGGFADKELIFKAMNNGWKIAKVYGSTETSSFVSFMNTTEVYNKPGASGKIIPPNEIKITVEREVIVKSPSIMKGYFNNEQETFSKLKNGFYQTGDLGFIDNEGYLFIESKRDDLIITGGENVNPVEVEKTILLNTKVKEVCVTGLDDSQWGQVIFAAVVLNENTDMTENELKLFLKDKISSFKIPKRFILIDHLPKSELGKVYRKQVKDMLSPIHP